MMPLEELVMVPLENTYISFLQTNTCERDSTIITYRDPVVTFASVVS